MKIDFHTHLDWYKNREELIRNLRDHCAGQTFVTASVDEESYRNNVELSENVGRTVRVIPTFGIHPMNATKELQRVNGNLDCFLPLMEQSPMIGEIGLDYFWSNEVDHGDQMKVFEFFVRWCHVNRKICVVHTKGAESEILSVLKKYPDAIPVIHWYDGERNVFDEMVSLGFYFTFGCETVCSGKLKEFLLKTPLERLLLETDNPDSETWLGGTDNTPMLISRIYRDVSEILSVDEDEIERQVEENFNRMGI